MRTPIWLFAVALLAAGCDRQLNAEWCAQNRNDQDCINAGLVQVDAPPACPMTPCTESGQLVCDTSRGGMCVQCVPGDTAHNPPNCHCGTDDACHDCLVDADCGAGGLCLPDYTCIGGGGSGSSGSPDNLLYATPNGTGDCTAASKCKLATAISMVTTMKHVIELDAGTYTEGPLTISQSMVLIGPNPGAGHVYRDPEDTTGRAVITAAGNGPVLTITAGTVALFEVTVAGSRDDAGIKCTNATLEAYHDVIRDNPKEGISATGCPLTVERSVFTKNGTTGSTYEGLYVNNCAPIAVRNNFFFGNGNSTSVKGAVHFVGVTAGDFRFNSVGYNHAEAGGPGGDFTGPKGPGPTAVGGVLCESGMVMARDNIVALNAGINFGSPPGGCQTMNSFIDQDPHWTSSSDLHLKSDSPSPAVVNNSNSDCSYAKGYDIDFDVRPMGAACDLGADESR
jgi:hypothetical protein